MTMPPQNENGYQFENDIREFLERVGFENVPRWGENRETLELGGQEIDAFGRLNNMYIVVDAKTANSPRGRARGVQTQLNIIHGYRDQVIQDIKNRYEAEHGYRDCLFIYWTRGKEIRQDHQRMAKSLGIALRDNFDLECYSEACDLLENEEMVRNSFLKDISLQLERNIFIEAPNITHEATMTRIGNKKFYTFLIQVRNLLKFAYVFRVETNNILASYQRLLNTTKIGKIREYLAGTGFFANNILVAADEDLAFDVEDPARAILTGTLNLPDKPCYLEIIDGQHRLLAYSNMPQLMDQCLCVTIISDLDKIERARLFAIVNREQTKVPPNLLWDLYVLIEPESKRGRISKYVQHMNNQNGPLKDLIKLTRVRSQSAFLSFTNLCVAFHSRTNFYEKYGRKRSFFNVVKGYFEVIQSDRSLRDDWNMCIASKGKRGFVCTNNALSVYIHLLSMILRKREQSGIPFPTSTEIDTWKRFLRQKAIPPIVRYLQGNSDPESPEDPYGALRQRHSSEGERRETAEEIFNTIEF